MAIKGRNKPRTASKNVTDKREAKKTIKQADSDLRYSGLLYPMTKQAIQVAREKGEDKTNPEGFKRMLEEVEKIESALKNKEKAEAVIKKFSKGTQDFRKGGMVLSTVDRRKK